MSWGPGPSGFLPWTIQGQMLVCQAPANTIKMMMITTMKMIRTVMIDLKRVKSRMVWYEKTWATHETVDLLTDQLLGEKSSCHLKTVAFAEAQFGVRLRLECIQRHLQKDNNLFICQNKPYDMIPDCSRLKSLKSHHDVEDVLCHTISVWIVNFLLRVIRWEPPNLGE